MLQVWILFIRPLHGLQGQTALPSAEALGYCLSVRFADEDKNTFEAKPPDIPLRENYAAVGSRDLIPQVLSQRLIWTSVLKQYPIFNSSLSNGRLQVANGPERPFGFLIIEVIDQKCAGEVYSRA